VYRLLGGVKCTLDVLSVPVVRGVKCTLDVLSVPVIRWCEGGHYKGREF